MDNTGGVSRRVVLIGAVAAVAVGTPLLWQEVNSEPAAELSPTPAGRTAPPTLAKKAPPGKYGSGVPVAWQRLSYLISDPWQIQRTVRSNGVSMFGDSIGVTDGAELARLLAGRTHDRIAVHNWSGRPTRPAVDALAQWARAYGLPGRILMATGSNDIFDPPVVARQVDRVMSLVGRSRRVVWVNVLVSRRGTRAADLRNSAWVNRHLEAATHRHPNLHVVHWAEFLDPRRQKRYLRDGVHTSELGRAARNELIVRSLAAVKAAAA
jgi:hypothetical protein